MKAIEADDRDDMQKCARYRKAVEPSDDLPDGLLDQPIRGVSERCKQLQNASSAISRKPTRQMQARRRLGRPRPVKREKWRRVASGDAAAGVAQDKN